MVVGYSLGWWLASVIGAIPSVSTSMWTNSSMHCAVRLLTQAFCRCYYQMAVQRVSVRSQINRICKQEGDLMLAALDFECG
jgi:hypothetical protein